MTLGVIVTLGVVVGVIVTLGVVVGEGEGAGLVSISDCPTAAFGTEILKPAG